MQILKDSKVKFVSAVGVSLLTSFWMCVWSSIAPGLMVLYLEKKKKSILLTLNLPSRFCWFPWML